MQNHGRTAAPSCHGCQFTPWECNFAQILSLLSSKGAKLWVTKKSCTSFLAPWKMHISPLVGVTFYTNHGSVSHCICSVCIEMTPVKTGSQLPPTNVLLQDQIQPEFKAEEKHHTVLCLFSSLLLDTHHKISAPDILFPFNTNQLIKVDNEGPCPPEQQTEPQLRFWENYSYIENGVSLSNKGDMLTYSSFWDLKNQMIKERGTQGILSLLGIWVQPSPSKKYWYQRLTWTFVASDCLSIFSSLKHQMEWEKGRARMKYTWLSLDYPI